MRRLSCRHSRDAQQQQQQLAAPLKSVPLRATCRGPTAQQDRPAVCSCRTNSVVKTAHWGCAAVAVLAQSVFAERLYACKAGLMIKQACREGPTKPSEAARHCIHVLAAAPRSADGKQNHTNKQKTGCPGEPRAAGASPVCVILQHTSP